METINSTATLTVLGPDRYDVHLPGYPDQSFRLMPGENAVGRFRLPTGQRSDTLAPTDPSDWNEFRHNLVNFVLERIIENPERITKQWPMEISGHVVTGGGELPRFVFTEIVIFWVKPDARNDGSPT